MSAIDSMPTVEQLSGDTLPEIAQPKEGQLAVYWIPQVPMQAFRVPVASAVEARRLLDTLGRYDQFQLATNVKPDYCNAGGLLIYEGGEWLEWHSSEDLDIDAHELVNGTLQPVE